MINTVWKIILYHERYRKSKFSQTCWKQRKYIAIFNGKNMLLSLCIYCICIYMYIVYSILYAAYSISMWNNVKDRLKSWNKVMYTNNWPENTNWLKSRLGIGYCFVWCWCLLWTAISLCQGTFIARKTNVGYGNFGFQILLSSFGFSTSNNTFWK